jgi:hypothetical protein
MGLHPLRVQCFQSYLCENQLKSEILSKFYEISIADNLSLERQVNSHHQTYWKTVYDKYLTSLLMGEVSDNGSLLDVGCGVANFIEVAKQKSNLP